MKPLRISALAIGLAAIAATPSLAQSYGTSGGMQNTQSGSSMQGMQGTHQMSGTVTSVDKSTGMISVTSEGKSLRLHFPSSALTNIKTGDKVTVQLGLMKT